MTIPRCGGGITKIVCNLDLCNIVIVILLCSTLWFLIVLSACCLIFGVFGTLVVCPNCCSAKTDYVKTLSLCTRITEDFLSIVSHSKTLKQTLYLRKMKRSFSIDRVYDRVEVKRNKMVFSGGTYLIKRSYQTPQKTTISTSLKGKRRKRGSFVIRINLEESDFVNQILFKQMFWLSFAIRSNWSSNTT